MDYPSYLLKHKDVISQAAEENNVPESLLAAIAAIESMGNEQAVSKATNPARGLMQINPITQKELGVEDPHDTAEAVPAAAGYIRNLLDRFGDPDKAVSAYNTGPGAARRGSFNETYARRVRDFARALEGDLDILEDQ